MANQNALAVVPESHRGGSLEITNEKKELLRRTVCKGASDDELEYCLAFAQHQALDALAGDMYFYKQREKRADGTWGEVIVPVVSIQGARKKAGRTGQYAGQVGPFWCGEDGVWKEVWLSSDPPAAAKVGVRLKGQAEPTFAVVTFASFARKNQNGSLSGKWASMPDHMLAIRAETHALKRACPDALRGLVTVTDVDDTEWTDTVISQHIDAELGAADFAALEDGQREVTWQDLNLQLHAIGQQRGMDHEAIKDYFSLETTKDLSVDQMQEMVDILAEDRAEPIDAEFAPVASDEDSSFEAAIELAETMAELETIRDDMKSAGITEDSHPGLTRLWKSKHNTAKIRAAKANRANQDAQARAARAA